VVSELSITMFFDLINRSTKLRRNVALLLEGHPQLYRDYK
jgi:hypothetical protein